ncbi:conserved Plasmodium membrane protein, unknown function [Plasmodium relictum]|uniref:Uncharacterized protein n=1 Tax=Plasmodium relictum TaxID=85471 RepID=A0A1J1H417_PLARL|nr:conserved Plasmodium membrane protein, unknown function [Plasmodium relictum]CRG99456.1 conserved Plasmodium membrane protein, unknown function [Plasmodium relictum]
MSSSKKEEIVNTLFTVFLVLIQQVSLLYVILNNTKNYHYFVFLVVDLFLCLYIVCSLYDKNNAGVKISIQWMIYMITLSMKMAIFCFFIRDTTKYTNNSTFLIYLNNDVLIYNLIYMTPFIYLLFSLRSRNILENILDNKIIIENILSVDVNIINLFDLIDLIFMYSHLTSIHKIVTDFGFYNSQKTYIMLIIVIIALLLFGFYFPIYTNIEKNYSYDETTDLLIKKKKKKKKYKYNGDDNSNSENFCFSSNSFSLQPKKSHSKKNSHLLSKSNTKSFKTNKITNFAHPIDNTAKNNFNKSLSICTPIVSDESTFASSDFSKELSSNSLSSSYFSLSSSPSFSSYLSPLFSFTSKNYKNKMNKSDNKKLRDVYTDVYITAKFHFIIGFFLIDIPFFIYRLLFCIRHKVMLTLIVKNILFLLFRSYKLNEYRLIEKEKHKKNKSNFDFRFYNIFNFDSESNDYNKSRDLKSEKTNSKYYEEKRTSEVDEELYSKRRVQSILSFFKNKNNNTKSKSEGNIKEKKKKNKKNRKIKKKKKKKIDVLKIFKEEFKNNKKKLFSGKNSIGSKDFDDNLYLNNDENNSDNYNNNSQHNNSNNKIVKNNKIQTLTKKEKRKIKRNMKKKKKTFLDLIYKLKYKREMPVYRFKIKDHILSFYNFTCKRFNSSNFVYFDDKLVFPYFTNLRFMLVILLDYFIKIGFTLFFIFTLLNRHTVINNNNLIYIHDIPLRNSSETILNFPNSFNLMNYPNLELPKTPINIYYINKDTQIYNQSKNKKSDPKGYVKLELSDNIFKLKWSEIYIVDKFCICTCIAYLIINFLLFMKTSTFFDILYVSIFNAIRHLSFYFSLKQFILFFFMFNGNIYNMDYIYYEKNIRKLNYHFEYLFLLFFNARYFIFLIKHFPLFFRILFNFKYVYYYRESKRSKENKKDELRYSISVYILFLLCKYSYAPVNLNSILFGKNILNNVILIDNINNFTWVNILTIILFKIVQILITKTNYFLIGLFILHIALYIIYAIHTQILRYIILRKIEILFAFKHILISKYKGIELVPDKNSPYVTCRDILKYYSEEGFFSSESNMIPNFI